MLNNMMLLPPPPDVCQICAHKHTPENPHNAQSMYYKVRFYGVHGRWPTWADAMAHCSPALQAEWKAALKEKDAWTEPEQGEPIADRPDHQEPINEAVALDHCLKLTGAMTMLEETGATAVEMDAITVDQVMKVREAVKSTGIPVGDALLATMCWLPLEWKCLHEKTIKKAKAAKKKKAKAAKKTALKEPPPNPLKLAMEVVEFEEVVVKVHNMGVDFTEDMDKKRKCEAINAIGQSIPRDFGVGEVLGVMSLALSWIWVTNKERLEKRLKECPK